ncbi:MAG: ATP-binding protein, partial [Salinivirgaceae bacterium]
METETIRNIISKGEGLQVEFKKALSAIPSDAYETIVSFSNTQGGTLLLGVNDDGTVVGVVQTAVQKMLKNLVSALNAVDNIYPPLYLQPTPHEINGKTIIVLQVPISSQVHKLKQKHIFIREVIGNVIVHREYKSAMATQLVIENNQVILTNPNNPHGHGPIDLDSFNPHPKNPNIRKFFTAMGWTDEIGS